MLRSAKRCAADPGSIGKVGPGPAARFWFAGTRQVPPGDYVPRWL